MNLSDLVQQAEETAEDWGEYGLTVRLPDGRVRTLGQAELDPDNLGTIALRPLCGATYGIGAPQPPCCKRLGHEDGPETDWYRDLHSNGLLKWPVNSVPVRVSAVEIIDGREVPIGTPRVTSISRGALDLLHGNVSPLGDRRQRAREAAHDSYDAERDGGAIFAESVEAAIETATRVQVTPEAIEAFGKGWHDAQHQASAAMLPRKPGDRRRAGLTAALRELGFEVVE